MDEILEIYMGGVTNNGKQKNINIKFKTTDKNVIKNLMRGGSVTEKQKTGKIITDFLNLYS